MDIIKTMEHIRNNYNEKISFEKLAHDIVMSYSAYPSHFKAAVKCNPGKYLNMCRIGKETGGLKLTENDTVSYSCCAAIGSAGTGLVPSSSAQITKQGVVLEFYINAKITLVTPGNNELGI